MCVCDCSLLLCIPVDYDCISFPGPGSSLPAAENPFFEFITADGYTEKHRTHKVDHEFTTFKNKHGRNYKDQSEEAQRKTHFRHNHRSEVYGCSIIVCVCLPRAHAQGVMQSVLSVVYRCLLLAQKPPDLEI